MTTRLRTFLNTIGLHAADLECVLDAYRALEEAEGAEECLSRIEEYRQTGTLAYSELLDAVRAACTPTGVHPYLCDLLTVTLLGVAAADRYAAEGLPEALYIHTMRDIKYKVVECRLVEGRCGTFVASWFEGFFRLTRFAFGLLQVECATCRYTVDLGVYTVDEGERVLNVHVPRTGARLTRAALLESYREAAAFMAARYSLPRVSFVLSSWLLFPAHGQMLGPEANLRHFIGDYTLAASGEYANYEQVWRLFDCRYDGNPDHLPADTSLRRAYVDRIRQGLPVGWGYGVFAYRSLVEKEEGAYA